MLMAWYALQRFAVPGLDVPLLLFLPWVIFLYSLLGKSVSFRLDGTLLFLCIFLIIAILRGLTAGEASLSSLAYVLAVYLPFAIRPKVLFPVKEAAIRKYIQVMIYACGFAIIQALYSWVTSQPLDISMLVPKDYLLLGYNNTYEVNIGFPWFKPNGGFLEPSFLSQYVALALLLVILIERRYWLVSLFSITLILSVSGTGLLLLLCVFPLLVLSRPKVTALLVCLFMVMVFVFYAVTSWSSILDIFYTRVFEYRSFGSSAAIRFINPYIEFFDYFANASLLELSFGIGPGAIETLSMSSRFDANFPSHLKVIGEYGLVGFVAFAVFSIGVIASLLKAYGVVVGLSVGLIYFVLSGAFLQPTSTVLMWILYQYSQSGRSP